MGISPFLAHVPINLSPSHCNIAWASPPHFKGSQKLAAWKQIYSDISINNVMQCILLFACRFPRTYTSIGMCFTELFRLRCLLYLASVFPQDALHQLMTRAPARSDRQVCSGTEVIPTHNHVVCKNTSTVRRWSHISKGKNMLSFRG